MSQVKSINKENLRIARENMGLNTQSASKQISASKTNLIEEWETGESLPTWAQVSKLAKLYNISELLFFANELLTKSKVIPDYRVGANHENDEKVKKLINLVISRQKWLEHEYKEGNLGKNTVLGLGKNINQPKKLAALIVETLDIRIQDIKDITGSDARKKALSYLIKKAEAKGVFVGKTISYIDLEVDDIRGLFVSNEYCPFIVINRRDAVSAQIFSFVHELAHLFRKSDAISNSLDFRTKSNGVNAEEVLCNKVAAELLLPEEEFTESYYEKKGIDRLSNIHKVSKLFIFYRLKELGKIHKEIQNELEKEIQLESRQGVEIKKAMENGKQGGNYTNSMKDSNGALFNKTISKAYLENKIGYIEASKLLRFSVEKA
mgnify:CR=1 FL=1